MVAFSNVLNTLGLARFKRRARGPAASDDPVLSAPCCTPVPPQADEFSVSFTEDADVESAKITTPDGAWERRWPRLALQPDEDPALSHATLVAAQAQVWDAARLAAGAVALTVSAVLLDDSIPPDARKHFQLGLHLLQGAIAADDAAALAPECPPAPEAAPPTSESQILRLQPFTSAAPDPTIDRRLPDHGVHQHLARPGALIFDLAAAGDTVLFRPPGHALHVPHALSHSAFARPAVPGAPGGRALVVLSRQFPWPVDVSALPGADCVTVADVLRRFREVARDAMRETEFQLALHAPGGRRRIARAHARRTRNDDGEMEEVKPLCLVDYLGERTILGSLRRDVDHAVLQELIPPPWLPGTEETLHLVAEFVSPADLQAVLKARP